MCVYVRRSRAGKVRRPSLLENEMNSLWVGPGCSHASHALACSVPAHSWAVVAGSCLSPRVTLNLAGRREQTQCLWVPAGQHVCVAVNNSPVWLPRGNGTPRWSLVTVPTHSLCRDCPGPGRGTPQAPPMKVPYPACCHRGRCGRWAPSEDLLHERTCPSSGPSF